MFHYIQPNDQRFKYDGFVKSPTSVLCFGLRCILRFFKVRKVRIITQDLRAMPILWIGGAFFFAIEILFLRVHQI
jgi:hypothetical protein